MEDWCGFGNCRLSNIGGYSLSCEVKNLVWHHKNPQVNILILHNHEGTVGGIDKGQIGGALRCGNILYKLIRGL